MTIRRLGIIAWLCVIAPSSGASNPVTQLGPSTVTTTASLLDDANTRLVPQSIGSCPDGNSPSWLQTWTKGSTARIRWTEVAPNIEYHVVIERYDVTNAFVPVDNGNVFLANQTWLELTLSEGRYRAKIQTRSCGKFMGPWSDELAFSVEGNDAPVSNDAPPANGESAEGTKVPSNESLQDASGNVWTLGDENEDGARQVLMNGSDAGGAYALVLKYHNHSVYAKGASGNWYVFGSGGWSLVGP